MRALSSEELNRVSQLLKFKYTCVGTGIMIVLLPAYLIYLYVERKYDYSFSFTKKIDKEKVSVENKINTGEINNLSDEEVDRLLTLIEKRKTLR
jgi:hypothetical protein